ncbi:hypothetical protein DZD41_07625, partial [Campylobacter hepaticus]
MHEAAAAHHDTAGWSECHRPAPAADRYDTGWSGSPGFYPGFLCDHASPAVQTRSPRQWYGPSYLPDISYARPNTGRF